MSCESSFSITLSAEDTLRAQESLWRIVRRQAMLYAPESSSLPIETVTALTKSVLLTLNAAQNPAILLAPDLDALFWQGQRRLRQKAALAHVLWKWATAMQPPPKHCFLQDTLHSLRDFPARYDWRFFAQEIPCSIDYQLFLPVPETLVGVDYVLEWLRRLCIELDILSRFDAAAVHTVLSEFRPDYQTLCINLLELPLSHAIALAALGEDARLLPLSPPQRQRLKRLFLSQPPDSCQAFLSNTARSLCDTLNVTSPQTQRYVETFACTLMPRLKAALHT